MSGIIQHSSGDPHTANPFLILPGIRERPANMDDWTDRAARNLRLEWSIDAEKLEYYLWAIRRPGKLRKLSDQLADVVRYYNVKGVVPNLLAHSNGNVIVCRMLRKHPDVRVGVFFMVMPACWSNCQQNGLNDALKAKSVKYVRCFHSREDGVVKWGGLTSFLRPLGMGYGRASYTGLTSVAPVIGNRVEQVDMTPWGHGTFGGQEALPGFLDYLVIPFAAYLGRSGCPAE